MNASRCPGCGDVHLCPGAVASIPAPGDNTLLDQIRRFVADTFEAAPHAVVGTLEAWEAYRHWCTMTGNIPYSNRRFIGAMNLQPGIRRVKRSTMRFVGITWKRSQTRGRHAAPEPALTR